MKRHGLAGDKIRLAVRCHRPQGATVARRVHLDDLQAADRVICIARWSCFGVPLSAVVILPAVLTPGAKPHPPAPQKSTSASL